MTFFKNLLKYLYGLDLVSFTFKTTYNTSRMGFPSCLVCLYIFMAFAFIRVFRDFKFAEKRKALILFFSQLIVNLCWSPAFFTLHNISLALIICAILWVLVLLTTLEFFKYSRLAGLLFVPYIIWVTCALWLNFQFLILN